mgnify:CR=1 FL=1
MPFGAQDLDLKLADFTFDVIENEKNVNIRNNHKIYLLKSFQFIKISKLNNRYNTNFFGIALHDPTNKDKLFKINSVIIPKGFPIPT